MFVLALIVYIPNNFSLSILSMPSASAGNGENRAMKIKKVVKIRKK
jgi:hypothetical protein